MNITVQEHEGVKSFVVDGRILLQTTGDPMRLLFADESLKSPPGWFPSEAAVAYYLEHA